jgi:hypothetical protein
MPTLTTILARADITPADQAIADIEVPILTGPQRQGDVLIIPRARIGKAEGASLKPVPAEGVAVVRGEATGNTHLLMADGPVMWAGFPQSDTAVALGVLDVPEGSVAHLLHTDEHGVNSIGAGTYLLHGKREMADEIRRVAD